MTKREVMKEKKRLMQQRRTVRKTKHANRERVIARRRKKGSL